MARYPLTERSARVFHEDQRPDTIRAFLDAAAGLLEPRAYWAAYPFTRPIRNPRRGRHQIHTGICRVEFWPLRRSKWVGRLERAATGQPTGGMAPPGSVDMPYRTETPHMWRMILPLVAEAITPQTCPLATGPQYPFVVEFFNRFCAGPVPIMDIQLAARHFQFLRQRGRR